MSNHHLKSSSTIPKQSPHSHIPPRTLNGHSSKPSSSYSKDNYAYVPNDEMSASSDSEEDLHAHPMRKQNRSRSRSGQSALSGRGRFNNKKRKIAEISNSINDWGLLKNELWIKKYEPQTLVRLFILSLEWNCRLQEESFWIRFCGLKQRN